jgi:hypothetical protein
MTTGSKADRKRAGGQQPSRVMTARELDAYLLSRDTLRRAQRISALLSQTSRRPATQHSSH